ncbi:restriction endonuclease subunit S [Sorangium sp. So ce1000]|uniref:restriction endonuclease subunit S n=1 Tax=Sorangium sp. So ce1000 TaxID=3133325 RepID=UPI003F5E37CF
MMRNPPWPSARLGEVAQIQTGLAKGKQPEEGKGVPAPYLRVANVQDGYVDLTELKTVIVEPQALQRYALQDGDVLFTEGGDADKLGRGCVWRAQVNPCLHQNHIFAVRAPRDVLLPSFLAAYAAGPLGKNYFLGCAKRTTNLASINSTQLRNFPVPIPPLAEQRKIAAILSSVDDAIEATQAVIDQLQVVKKAMMAELLARGLPGRHTRFKKTEIGEVPEEWDVRRLGDLAELQPGYPFRSLDFVAEGQRLLRGSNVGVARLDWGDDRTVYFPSHRVSEVTAFVLEEGDIVIAMDRPFISEGFKVARVAQRDLPALLLQRVGRFRRLRLKVDFLWCLLHSAYVQGHLRTLQKGTDLPHISKAEIESCLVPVPGILEQEQIGKLLAELGHLATANEATLTQVRSLKFALQSALLSGEIRVTPDEAAP